MMLLVKNLCIIPTKGEHENIDYHLERGACKCLK